MKLFLIKSLVFFGISLIFVVISILWLNYIYSNLFANYKIADNINTIIIGDSHTSTAINNHIFPNTDNISQPREGFFYSYFKLQGILSRNAQIKTVLLGFSYHNISSYFNDINDGGLSSDYFFILPFDQKVELLLLNKNRIGQYLSSIIINNIKNIVGSSNRIHFLGKYDNDNSNIAITYESIRKRINTFYYPLGPLADFSSINILYLDKIIELCKTRNVKLILLNTPMHQKYLALVPKKFKTKYYSMIKVRKLNLIEFGSFKLNDSCFLPDGDHVSEEGAKITTINLIEIMKKQ